MRYEYRVDTVGMSAWESLEDIGVSLQTALNFEKGLLLIFWRPAS